MKGVLCVIVSIIMILLCSSCAKEDNEYMSNSNNKTLKQKEITIGEKAFNDDLPKEQLLTKQYDIDELLLFFEGSSQNLPWDEKNTRTLTFAEVDRKFPVEVVRSSGYSVYKVLQGGYFYVFWVTPVVSVDDNFGCGETLVYFYAYLRPNVEQAQFELLMLQKSTACDVKKIDPSFQLSFIQSNGIYSYTYINSETILEVKYMNPNQLNGYDDLIIEKIEIIPREFAPSRYSSILSKDLPKTGDGLREP